MHILAVIPARDEARRIGPVVDGALRHADVVLVIDDGSTDDTAGVASGAGAGRPLVVLRLPLNGGKGPALAVGFGAALLWADGGHLGEADAVVTLDADGQHDPSDIRRVVDPLATGAEVSIGRRDLRAYPAIKRAGNRWLCAWGRLWGGVPFADLECGYRAFRVSALRRILPYYRGWGYSAEHETGVIAARLGLHVVDDVPIESGTYVRGSRPWDAVPVMVRGAAAAIAVHRGRPGPPMPPRVPWPPWPGAL